MQIVGEYGNSLVNGAGCGGAEAQGQMFLNAGTSASSAGSDQSTFAVYALDESGFDANVGNPKENFPFPKQIFKDTTNTNTNGNIDGTSDPNETGQLPNLTTRRDSHGSAATLNGNYVHVNDRIQNVVEVFDAKTGEHVNTYDLVSTDGKSGREGPSGPCLNRSVLDDPFLNLNDPAPDLMQLTPDGKHLVIAFRGPKPVTVSHAAQGSCPGVGIVELSDDGMSGKLVDVLRSTNTIDTVPGGIISGGTDYTGAERSDMHGAIVVAKN